MTVTKTSTSNHANEKSINSFTFPVDDGMFAPTDPQPKPFTRKSADSINTRFVAEEFSGGDWQFTSGSANEDAFLAAKQRHQARARQGRQSPAKTPGLSTRQNSTSEPNLNTAAQQPKGGFDPNLWSEQIGADAFVPQPPRNHTASPAKTNRPIKKPKPVRKTAGTAGLVDEDESSSSEERTRPPTATADYAIPIPTAPDSPVAMEIDTPTVEPSRPAPAPQPSTARNIPVEPSKPEWRAGNVNGVTADSKPPPAAPARPPKIPTSKLGSEDTSGFFGPNLSDFTKVAPFAPQVSGLGSLGDLAFNLPFESKPAPKVTLEVDEDTTPADTNPNGFSNNAHLQAQPSPTATSLSFPSDPKPPHPPPVLAIPHMKPSTEAWAHYVREFHAYMEQWADFNARVTDHFSARKGMMEESRRRTNFTWVEARDDAGMKKYIQWLEEDQLVRRKWMAACEDHERRVREFLGYREKMML